jgi:hypothetical protein
MTRRPRSVDLLRPAGRRLAAGLFLVAAPKCLLCLAAYAGLGTALGLGGQELCGAPAEGAGSAMGPADLAAVVILLVSAGFLQRTRHTAPGHQCR